MSNVVKLVFLACVLVVTAKPLTEEEKHAMYSELTGNCKDKEGASDFDVQELMAHKIPSTRSGQCLRACVFDGIGITENGKLSVDGTIKVAEMSGDQTKVKNAQAIGKECQSVGADDRCDSVVQVMLCIAKVAAALGVVPHQSIM